MSARELLPSRGATASKPAVEEMDMDKHMAQMQENMKHTQQQMDWIRGRRDFRF